MILQPRQDEILQNKEKRHEIRAEFLRQEKWIMQILEKVEGAISVISA